MRRSSNRSCFRVINSSHHARKEETMILISIRSYMKKVECFKGTTGVMYAQMQCSSSDLS